MEAQSAIARIMFTSVEYEALIESTRLVLADRHDFDPEQAVLRMDRDRKGVITAGDVVQFMRHNRQEITEAEALLFIRPFDDDCDEALDYNEWLYCVLSSSVTYRDKVVKRMADQDWRLRRLSRDKTVVIMNPNPRTLHPLESLPYEVEYGIRRVIEQEIELQNQLEKLRFELS